MFTTRLLPGGSAPTPLGRRCAQLRWVQRGGGGPRPLLQAARRAAFALCARRALSSRPPPGLRSPALPLCAAPAHSLLPLLLLLLFPRRLRSPAWSAPRWPPRRELQCSRAGAGEGRGRRVSVARERRARRESVARGTPGRRWRGSRRCAALGPLRLGARLQPGLGARGTFRTRTPAAGHVVAAAAAAAAAKYGREPLPQAPGV